MEIENQNLEFKDIKVGSAYYFLLDDTNEGMEYRAYMYADKVNGLDNSISGWAYVSVISTHTTCFPISKIRYYSFIFDSAKVRVAENIIYPMGLHNSICEYVSDLEVKINEQLDLISKKLNKTTKAVKLREKDQFTIGYKAAMNRPLWKRMFKKYKMKTPFYKVYIFKHGKVYFTSDPFYNRNDALLHLHEWFDILYDDSAAIISNTGKTIFEITTKHTKDENAI